MKIDTFFAELKRDDANKVAIDFAEFVRLAK
jgi:hypothetical protein